MYLVPTYQVIDKLCLVRAFYMCNPGNLMRFDLGCNYIYIG